MGLFDSIVKHIAGSIVTEEAIIFRKLFHFDTSLTLFNNSGLVDTIWFKLWTKSREDVSLVYFTFIVFLLYLPLELGKFFLDGRVDITGFL